MRAYERFLHYAVVNTTSDPDSGLHPSAARELDLGRQLAAELKALGLADAHMTENGYVYASLPASPGCEKSGALGLIAHLDTAPDAPGQGVKPQLHPNYDGGTVTLPGTGAELSPQRFPFLQKLKGETLITSDGTTLLGADDKAGVAEIFTAVERILQENRPHSKLCIAVTPDEEIGEGASLFDVKAFGADYAFTVDGDDVGEIDYENFNAAAAVVTVHGFSVHPGTAKGILINAQNVAIEFHQALPQFERPEYTEGYQGFFHLTSMMGDVNQAKLGYIIRDHDAVHFAQRKQTMEEIAQALNARYGQGTVKVELTDSYYNMREKIKPHWHLIENARKAVRAAGLEPMEQPVRGGTDGAMLSFRGLPCPNLGTGGFNFHGPFECITVERMDRSVEVLLNLIALYQKPEVESGFQSTAENAVR